MLHLENYEEGPLVEGALQELSNGGFGLKIGNFFADIWPFLSPPVQLARWAHMHRFLSVVCL